MSTAFDQMRTLVAQAEEMHEKLRTRAETSYREGYEAGRKSMEPACVDAFRNGQANARPELASNPLDLHVPNIWEMVDMLASTTAAMRGLADALAAARAGREHFRSMSWEQEGEIDKLRDQLRLLTKERDEWREEAMALRRG